MTDRAERQELAKQLASLMTEYRQLQKRKAANYIELVELAMESMIKAYDRKATVQNQITAHQNARAALHELRDWLRMDMENP